MIDRAVLEADVRIRLAPLEPLRRRVIRVYWTRGLLTLLLLFSAATLGMTAGVAATLWMLRVSGAAEDGELAVRIVPLLLAFVAPLALIALGAAVIVAAIVRGFGRTTVLEYEGRFRTEVVAPLLRGAFPLAQLDLEGRVLEAAVQASGLFAREERADASGSLLVQGRADGVSFAVSTLRVRKRGRRLGRRVSLFRGLFGSIDLPGRFDEAILLPDSSSGRGHGWPRPPKSLQPVDLGDPAFAARFKAYARDPQRAREMLGAPMRALLLELERRAGTRLCVSLHAAGVAIAVPARRDPFEPAVRPYDAEELMRHAHLYALIPEVARALAALPR